MAETFLVDYAQDDESAVVRFVGELDISDAERARDAGLAAVAALGSEGSRLIIDVSELAFCDSRGLHALIAIRDAASDRGCAVVLRRPQAMLRRILEATGVDELFTIDDG